MSDPRGRRPSLQLDALATTLTFLDVPVLVVT